MKKKILAFSLVIMLIMLMSSATANEIEPYVYEVCNGKPYHEMVAHWLGTAYVDGKLYLTTSPAWQCSGCNYVMITEGDLLLTGETVGKWAGAAYSTQLGPVEYVFVYAEDHGTCNSTKMDGYKFVIGGR